MTARPDHQSAAETWRGSWINFYQYRGGQSHLGVIISATREEADKVRAIWFESVAERAKLGLVMAVWVPTREPYEIIGKFERQIADDHPNVAKAKNCLFSIAIPHEVL